MIVRTGLGDPNTPASAGLQALVDNGAGNISWFTNLGDEINLNGPENDVPGDDDSQYQGFPIKVNQSVSCDQSATAAELCCASGNAQRFVRRRR